MRPKLLLLMFLMMWTACKHDHSDSYDEVFFVSLGDSKEEVIKTLIEHGIDTATIEKQHRLATNADTLQRYEEWRFTTKILGTETDYEIEFWLDKNLVDDFTIDFKEKDMEAYSRAIALLKIKFPTVIEINRITEQDCTYHLSLFDTTIWLNASYNNKNASNTPTIYFNKLDNPSKRPTLDSLGWQLK